MELMYKNKKFRAIVATPGIGKSYLCDRYNELVDIDELRLFCKYYIPDNITREELEKTKSRRPYDKRKNFKELFEKELDKVIESDKILICAPHKEIKEILVKKHIPYAFVYPSLNMKEEIKNRMVLRGNLSDVVKENDDLFYTFYHENKLEPFAIVKYRLKRGEFLEDVLVKMGLDFNLLTKREIKK